MTTDKGPAPKPEEYGNRADYAAAYLEHKGIPLDSKLGRAGFFSESYRWDAWNESRPERKAARAFINSVTFWLP
jgi:hypothetical protein